jgi:hypothetical protein
MIKRAQLFFDNLTRRKKFLLLSLIAQLIFYWLLVFVLPAGNEFVAYQQY